MTASQIITASALGSIGIALAIAAYKSLGDIKSTNKAINDDAKLFGAVEGGQVFHGEGE